MVVAEVSGFTLASPIAEKLLGLLGKAFDRALERKAKCWLENVAASHQFSGTESLEATISENVDEEWAQEIVHLTIRTIMNTLDQAVIPTLAALSAVYLSERSTPDLFFRRACRVLSDLKYDGLRELEKLCEICRRRLGTGPAVA